MTYTYYTRGTYSTRMDVELKDGIVENVTIYNGCNGNLKGICALVKGMKADEVVKRLKGIRCGNKNTSCPDQLAIAITEAMANAN